jgi:Cof subfamily protein (haloacid dehalogenase superfamily)
VIRIVFSDIDGTLLNKERWLSERTVQEVARVLAKGIPFVPASSRMPRAIRPLMEACGISGPLIAYNGALVLGAPAADGVEPVIYTRTIPFPVLLAVAAFWSDSSIHVSVFRNDEWFTEDEDQWMEREINNTRVKPNVLPLNTLVEMWQLRQMGPHKIMCMGDEEELTILQVLLVEKYAHQVQVYRVKPTYLELSPAGVSKAMGAELVMVDYGVDFRAAAAFGDQINDLAMLQKAAYGTAMANAPEAVKRASKYQAPANVDDGVAVMLRKWIP